MISNRSVPVDTVVAHIVYEDVAEAIQWLSAAFGFREHYRYGDPGAPNGAQLLLEKACVMVRQSRAGQQSPKQLGGATQSLTVFVEDVDEHFERAKAAGVKITEALHETEYGERQYGAEDPAGHRWLFSRHARDVNPEDWGATLFSIEQIERKSAASKPNNTPENALPNSAPNDSLRNRTKSMMTNPP